VRRGEAEKAVIGERNRLDGDERAAEWALLRFEQRFRLIEGDGLKAKLLRMKKTVLQ
jgi:hypothetical protein